jgi:hypothetical protein
MPKIKTHSRQDLGTRSTANGGNVRQPGKTSVLLDAIPDEVGNPTLRIGGVVHNPIT